MKVKFIAHAGFHIEYQGFSIVIDPWFFSSNFDYPVLKGLLPTARTIDFQVPNAVDKIDNINPDGIFVSHFHVHHAPLREVQHWLQKREKTVLAFPKLNDETKSLVTQTLANLSSKADLHAVEHMKGVQVGPFEVTGFFHCVPQHMGWIVRCPDGIFVHLADPTINKDKMSKQLDPFWQQFKNLKPDLFFISASGTCTEWKEADGTKSIWENSIASPAEAARIASVFAPKVAAPMGVYNNSIWKDRIELTLPPWHMEIGFHWALRYLVPETIPVTLRPGCLFEVTSEGVKFSPDSRISF